MRSQQVQPVAWYRSLLIAIGMAIVVFLGVILILEAFDLHYTRMTRRDLHRHARPCPSSEPQPGPQCSIERSADGSLDDRCAPCEQQAEQQKLDEFVHWQRQEAMNLYGSYFYATFGSLNVVDEPSAQDPLFPGADKAVWSRIYERARQINLDLLDPYDAASFAETYLHREFYGWYGNQTAEAAVCARRAEDWILPSTALTPVRFLFAFSGVTAPERPTSRGAWILDPVLFEYFVGQVEQAIGAINKRTDGDWWTAVHADIVAHGGVLRSAFVSGHLGAVASDMAMANPATVPQPVKKYIAGRGYAMTAAEDARLTDVLTRYYAAQSRFYTYSLSVTPALVNPISFNDWSLQYGWTGCFGYTNGLWHWGMNVSDLERMFYSFKNSVESMSAELRVERDALWPQDAWLPWTSTWLHYTVPEGAPNTLNITGWGLNSSLCNTINPRTGLPLFSDELSRAVHRYDNSKYQLYHAYSGSVSTWDMALNTGGCTPFAGNAGNIHLPNPRSERWVAPHMYGSQGPFWTVNLTYGILVHERKHVEQGMFYASACPTCYGRSATMTVMQAAPGATSLPATMAADTWRIYAEGAAADSEELAFTLQEDRWESFHHRLFWMLNRKIGTTATFGIRLGIWDLSGAMTWINQFSPYPGYIPSSTIYSRAITDMGGIQAWYSIGMWKVEDFRARAQARCGAAFDARRFNTLTHALGRPATAAYDRLLNDYIEAGCVSPTTRYGDAMRTVVAPALRR